MNYLLAGILFIELVRLATARTTFEHYQKRKGQQRFPDPLEFLCAFIGKADIYDLRERMLSYFNL